MSYLPDGWFVEFFEDGRWRVNSPGGGGPYLVDVLHPEGPRCSCAHDAIKLDPRREEGEEPKPCKHVARLASFLGWLAIERMREAQIQGEETGQDAVSARPDP